MTSGAQAEVHLPPAGSRALRADRRPGPVGPPRQLGVLWRASRGRTSTGRVGPVCESDGARSRRGGQQRTTYLTKEAPSASSPASTTGSASPRSDSSDPAASRSASSRSRTPSGWPQESDLDLVEVAPMARPPVCKLMDYGKFKYEAAQKAREARTNQAHTVIKEMKLRPKIDPHDYETKKGHVVRFLKRRRQGQDHDHVPRTRAVPPGARASGCCSGSPRTSRSSGFVESIAEAGRSQHDHGAGSAPEEGRGDGRGEAKREIAHPSDGRGRRSSDLEPELEPGAARATGLSTRTT